MQLLIYLAFMGLLSLNVNSAQCSDKILPAGGAAEERTKKSQAGVYSDVTMSLVSRRMDYKKIADDVSQKIRAYSQDTSGWKVTKSAFFLLLSLPFLPFSFSLLSQPSLDFFILVIFPFLFLAVLLFSILSLFYLSFHFLPFFHSFVPFLSFTTTYKYCVSFKNITVSWKPSNDYSGNIYRGETIIEESPEKLIPFMYLAKYRSKWDKTLKSYTIVEEIDENTLLFVYILINSISDHRLTRVLLFFTSCSFGILLSNSQLSLS
ncbi:unnamed protein product [Ranitomeya imitator]|uniref:START domain-containing protein n=1 Tax=Ranitomeya imitator TaxID=111125 RepID=A0ABN9L0N3_9NEOB|nr:unnamed protein product [Ranitomeya imitator]